MITDPVQAEHILNSGQADMVALAREFLSQPALGMASRTTARRFQFGTTAISPRTVVLTF